MAESEKAPTTRRGVLRGLAGTLGAALALTAAGKQPAAAEPLAAPEARPLAAAAPLTSDLLGRMHSEWPVRWRSPAGSPLGHGD